MDAFKCFLKSPNVSFIIFERPISKKSHTMIVRHALSFIINLGMIQQLQCNAPQIEMRKRRLWKSCVAGLCHYRTKSLWDTKAEEMLHRVGVCDTTMSLSSRKRDKLTPPLSWNLGVQGLLSLPAWGEKYRAVLFFFKKVHSYLIIYAQISCSTKTLVCKCLSERAKQICWTKTRGNAPSVNHAWRWDTENDGPF